MSAQGMPPQILALFAPRLPLNHVPPAGGYGNKPDYSGLTEYTKLFETTSPPPVLPFEAPAERRERKKNEKREEHRKKQEELIAQYDPKNSECATKNPFATLFVGRISYETTEKKLKKEFECFGPIRRVKIITDFNGKSRGYAFIEYESESDVKKAYKQGDGKKIDGRRVIVDVERARTVSGWLPRRLGGGKGPPRFAEPKKKGRPPPLPSGPVFLPPVSRGGTGWPGGFPRGGGGGGRGGGFRRDDNRRGSFGGGGGRDSGGGGGRFSVGGRPSFGGGGGGPPPWERRGDDNGRGAPPPRNYDGGRRRSRSRDRTSRRPDMNRTR